MELDFEKVFPPEKHFKERLWGCILKSDALFHVLKNIPIDWDLGHITVILYTLPNFFDLYLRVLVPCHVKQDWECFLHLITWDTHAYPVVLYTKSVKSSPEPLI